MSAQFEYPDRKKDEHGFVFKYTIITRELCFALIKKELPETESEAMKLCQHFSSRAIEVGNGAIFRPYESKEPREP